MNMRMRTWALTLIAGCLPAWAEPQPNRLGAGSTTVALTAVLAPLLAELLKRFKVPIVVLEILLGMAIGPHGLGLVSTTSLLGTLSLLGLCFLFFMAGLEIDFFRIRGRPLQLAFKGWAISLAVALSLACLLEWLGLVRAPILVSIALSTTAIGTLIPILKESGELETDFGTLLLAIGAAGEFGPIALISLAASQHSSGLLQGAVLLAFSAWLGLAAWLAHRIRPVRVIEWLRQKMHTTAQLPVRICVFLMALLVFVAGLWGIDVILGAFGAGVLVGLTIRQSESTELVHKLDSLSFGFLIPIFFIGSGVKFDLPALATRETQLRTLLFLALLLVARGLPALLLYPQLITKDRWALAFYTSTGLPLIVAIAEIGRETGLMLPENCVALVGAGMLSVLFFPLLGASLRSPRQDSATNPDSGQTA